MRYLSICSGIEAATVAWHPLGWTPLAFAEIEAFPSAVLAHHYPHVPNLGDMTKFHEWRNLSIDLLVGGTPCQAFSVAGLREGLNDPRGNLTLTFLALAARYLPRWLVWENVPGVLSDRTNAFGQLLAGLAQLGYGWAYRVFDAQFFGLAQRRKRVFVVAHLGDWTRAAEVLFEPDCLCGNPPPSREAGQEVAGTLSSRTSAGGGLGTDFDLGGGVRVADVAPTLNAHFGDKQGLENQHIDGGAGCSLPAVSLCLNAGGMGRCDAETETLIPTRQGGFFDGPTHALKAEGFDASEDGTGRGTPLVTTLALRGRGGQPVLETRSDGTANAILTPNGGRGGIGVGAIAYAVDFRNGIESSGATSTLQAKKIGYSYNAAPALRSGMQVRRLTPRECERLQGFPDDYTLIPYRGKPAKDGPRYKALGNSMAVPCMCWIGRRIASVDAGIPADFDFS